MKGFMRRKACFLIAALMLVAAVAGTLGACSPSQAPDAADGAGAATTAATAAAAATEASATEAAAQEAATPEPSASAEAPASEPAGDAQGAQGADDPLRIGEYPKAATDVTLRYYVTLNANVSAIAPTVNELPFTEEEYERTGIKVVYEHPPQGQENERFNLMMASNDLPDMIVASWYNIDGGPQKMINDGYIADLNTLIDYAPNFKRLLDEQPDVDRMVRTEEGSLYSFPCLKLDPELRVFYGPIVRADWLRDLGIAPPETMEEWHDMLARFRDEKGADAPLSYTIANGAANMNTYGLFIGAYGIKNSFYLDGDTIRHGALEPSYRDFVTEFARWYGEGLIDPNLPAVDNKALDAQILNGNTGATTTFNGSGLGRYLQAKQDEGDTAYDLVATKAPVLAKGSTPEFGQIDFPYSGNNCVAISAQSEHKELAAQFLDYAFSPEGNMFYNFGTEGLSYEMQGGEPIFTDLILNNPDGLSISHALARYTHSSYEGPYPLDIRYFKQIYLLQQQKDAFEAWTDHNGEKHLVPRFALTDAESEEYAVIMTDVNPYLDEMLMKFIMGVEPLENYEQFAQELRGMKLERAIEIQQAGYNRYLAR
ncbi:MAG: extracellular solute-binding protein [Clostridiales bacterium]|nr:extracellular solute-binding protein [Clostridiales bacterium]